MDFIKKNYKYILLIIIVLISLIFYVYEKNQKIVVNDKEIPLENKGEKIAVYITGAVNKEGVYYCEKNARLNDIISEAGGIKKNADIDKINLAKKIIDGDKVIIPYKSEEIEENNESNDNKKINLNSASKTQLMEIPGVGESTANKIIEYREKNSFVVIEDLMNVPGIGESKFEKIKDLVLV